MSIMQPIRPAAYVLLFATLAGCGVGRNYLELEGPRYAAAPADPQPAPPADTLRIASFNIEFAMRVDSALAVLEGDSALKGAHIILLQEMDDAGTRRIAQRLGMWYVYYPASFHFRTRRDFGNAVLSRWPIVEDRKLVLPNRSRYSNTLRTATAATIVAGTDTIRVYSAHLGTYADVDAEARAEQLRYIAEDAARYRHVIIAGDMNDPVVGNIMGDLGYRWPTQNVAKTSILGRLDHIFLKGFDVPDENGAGTVTNVRGASDHLPVWAIAILPY
jgi:endonuclease/exonuclease/phosphatase family metal-dependent hydrolase